jgi:hypothetical protein
MSIAKMSTKIACGSAVQHGDGVVKLHKQVGKNRETKVAR